MPSYTNVFGGNVVYPSEISYRAFTIAVNTALSWPTELATDTNVVAQIMDVTASVGSLELQMPDATGASVGETTLIFNVGSEAFTVTDDLGGTIVSIAPGLAYQIYLTDNTTPEGAWRSIQYGAGTSSATAGSLAGRGVKAIGTTLNQSIPASVFSVDYTLGVGSDRAGFFIWTGGAGTLTFPLASDAGNDWFVQVRNGGAGALTLAPSGVDLINGGATLIMNPGDSAIIACSGSAWFTIGLGKSASFTFDYDSINLTGQTSPYSLSGANLNRIAYNFGGTLLSNFTIIVPTTIQQYWVTNDTTGGFDLTIRTAAGTGVTLANGASSILYCNGTDVVQADTKSFAFPIAITDGGTGATNATDARTNLDVAQRGINSDITSLTALSGGAPSGPALTFSSDSNTGIYSPGADQLGIAAGGSNILTASTSGIALATALTVPNGGTGVTSATANGVLYGNGTSALQVTAAGTTGQVLVGNTGSAPSWANLTSVGVTSITFGSTGLTPSIATQGAVTVGGTLGVANGGTGATTLTSGYLIKGNGTSAVSASIVYDTGTGVGVGTSSPLGRLTSERTAASAGWVIAARSTGVSNETGVYVDASNNMEFAARNGSGTLTARIGSSGDSYITSGNFGVGTNSPGSRFAVSDVSKYTFSVSNAYTLLTSLNAAGSAFADAYTNALSHIWQTSGTERMRIDSFGTMMYNGSSIAGSGVMRVSAQNVGYALSTWGGANYTAAQFVFNAGQVGSITCTSTATAYNTSSDYRLKEDPQPIVGAIDRVLQLNPVNFAWKVDGSRVDGFIAHEAQAVVPEAVHGEKDAVDEDGNPVYQGIDQSKLVPLLTAALQETLGRINILETRLAALEAK